MDYKAKYENQRRVIKALGTYVKDSETTRPACKFCGSTDVVKSGIIQLSRSWDYQNKLGIIAWIRSTLIQMVNISSTTKAIIFLTPFLYHIVYICRPLAYCLDYHASIYYHVIIGKSISVKDYLASNNKYSSILDKAVSHANMP